MLHMLHTTTRCHLQWVEVDSNLRGDTGAENDGSARTTARSDWQTAVFRATLALVAFSCLITSCTAAGGVKRNSGRLYAKSDGIAFKLECDQFLEKLAGNRGPSIRLDRLLGISLVRKDGLRQTAAELITTR